MARPTSWRVVTYHGALSAQQRDLSLPGWLLVIRRLHMQGRGWGTGHCLLTHTSAHTCFWPLLSRSVVDLERYDVPDDLGPRPKLDPEDEVLLQVGQGLRAAAECATVSRPCTC